MTDGITPSVGTYSSVVPAEDNEMHEITETDSMRIMCEPSALLHSAGITSLYNKHYNPTADGSFMENRSGSRRRDDLPHCLRSHSCFRFTLPHVALDVLLDTANTELTCPTYPLCLFVPVN